jgi:hypothetical protein
MEAVASTAAVRPASAPYRTAVRAGWLLAGLTSALLLATLTRPPHGLVPAASLPGECRGAEDQHSAAQAGAEIVRARARGSALQRSDHHRVTRLSGRPSRLPRRTTDPGWMRAVR